MRVRSAAAGLRHSRRPPGLETQVRIRSISGASHFQNRSSRREEAQRKIEPDHVSYSFKRASLVRQFLSKWFEIVSAPERIHCMIIIQTSKPASAVSVTGIPSRAKSQKEILIPIC